MKKDLMKIKTIILTVIALILASGCAHSVRINTEPEGADVSVNGVYLGKSPVIHNERSGFPKSYFVKIEKDGFKKMDTALVSTYKADITLLLLIPGIVPYFFTADLEDTYNFHLQRGN